MWWGCIGDGAARDQCAAPIAAREHCQRARDGARDTAEILRRYSGGDTAEVLLRCARIHSRDLVREQVARRPQVVSKDKMFMVMDFMEHDLKGLMNAMTQPFTASEARGGCRRRPALGAAPTPRRGLAFALGKAIAARPHLRARVLPRALRADSWPQDLRTGLPFGMISTKLGCRSYTATSRRPTC